MLLVVRAWRCVCIWEVWEVCTRAATAYRLEHLSRFTRALETCLHDSMTSR